jgi:post-segregation antitoxin (ccd killing protein)
MGAETLTLDIDAGLAARLREAGIEPAAYAMRLLRERAAATESGDAAQARRDAWRREHREELGSYDRFIAEHGLWNDGLRPF